MKNRAVSEETMMSCNKEIKFGRHQIKTAYEILY
jgi:hypothetical protein